MARHDTFHCSVITPERAVLETEATFAAVPAHDGELGILRNRAPLLYKLGAGPLRVVTPEGTHYLFVDGGFVQMVDNRLTLLTEVAQRAEEIDPAAVERTMAEVRELAKEGGATRLQRQRLQRRAQVQKALLAKRAADERGH